MAREYVIPALRRPELNSEFSLSHLDFADDIKILHPWFQMDYAIYWNMQGLDFEQTRNFYIKSKERGVVAYMGFYKQGPAFLMECYDPRKDPLGHCYPVLDGDVGMHFFVGPANAPIHGFTLDALRNIMAFIFDEMNAERVVVEPDIKNPKVHRLNALVGFSDAGTINLPGKTARLAFCLPGEFFSTLASALPGRHAIPEIPGKFSDSGHPKGASP